MLNCEIDFIKTLTLVATKFVNVMDYMNTLLDEFTIIIPKCGNMKWVFTNLLWHIYEHNCAFLKHLHCFMKIAHECGESKVLCSQKMLAY